MKPLNKKQKIFVLKEMIRYYENQANIIAFGMCYLLSGLLKEIGVANYGYEALAKSLPEFKRPKNGYCGGYWFPRTDAQSRLNYCKSLLKLIESK